MYTFTFIVGDIIPKSVKCIHSATKIICKRSWHTNFHFDVYVTSLFIQLRLLCLPYTSAYTNVCIDSCKVIPAVRGMRLHVEPRYKYYKDNYDNYRYECRYYACKRKYKHKYEQVYTCWTWTYAYLYIYLFDISMHVHITMFVLCNTWMGVFMYVWMYVGRHVILFVCMFVCLYVCMSVCTYALRSGNVALEGACLWHVCSPTTKTPLQKANKLLSAPSSHIK